AATAGEVPGGALGRAEARGPQAHQVARPPAQLRLDPRLGRDAAFPDSRPPWSLVDRDDGTVCAPRGVSDGRVHASALRCRTDEGRADSTCLRWAPGGPEHPRLS